MRYQLINCVEISPEVFGSSLTSGVAKHAEAPSFIIHKILSQGPRRHITVVACSARKAVVKPCSSGPVKLKHSRKC